VHLLYAARAQKENIQALERKAFTFVKRVTTVQKQTQHRMLCHKQNAKRLLITTRKERDIQMQALLELELAVGEYQVGAQEQKIINTGITQKEYAARDTFRHIAVNTGIDAMEYTRKYKQDQRT